MGMTISSQAEVITRKCVKCGEVKSSTEFYFRKSKGGRLDTRCIPCVKDYNLSYYENNRERVKQQVAGYAKKNKDRILAYLRADSPKRHKAKKEKILNHYGRSCVCCGESNIAFLTVDHVDNDGADHKREMNHSNLYWWIIKNNFPSKPRFQTMCYNCNMGRSRNGGICPHKTSEGSETIRKE